MYAAVVQRNNRRMLHFQTIQRANSMVTRVQLHSFQSSMNASIVSPLSDFSVAHAIVTFCNRSDTVYKTVNRRTVKLFYKNGAKMERSVNIILSHTVCYSCSVLSVVSLQLWSNDANHMICRTGTSSVISTGLRYRRVCTIANISP